MSRYIPYFFALVGEIYRKCGFGRLFGLSLSTVISVMTFTVLTEKQLRIL